MYHVVSSSPIGQLNSKLRTARHTHNASTLYIEFHINIKMRPMKSLLPQLLLLGSSLVSAASWSFEDASVSIQGKGSVDRANKEKYVELCNTDYLKTDD